MKYHKEANIIDAVIRDLESYLESLRAAARRKGADNSSVEAATTFTQTENIDIRLEFLSFVNMHLGPKNKSVSIDQLKRLWKTLVRSPVSPYEKQQFIAWLTVRSGRGDGSPPPPLTHTLPA